MAGTLDIPEEMLRFLNSLPVTGDPFAWIPVFREELARLLGDVDRITVSVNFNCDLQDPENYRPEMSIAQHVPVIQEEGMSGTTTLKSMHGTPIERLVEELHNQGYPLDDYYPPLGFDFYLSGQAYLGVILLWRERCNPPISDVSQKLMGSIEPFLAFVLSDLVARRQQAEPDVRIFSDALQQLTNQVKLSRQEQRVVILQLFGHSYKDIADLLGVSVDGAKHHLKMVHRKTGTRSYTELFAKYFMPRLNLQGDDGEEAEGEIPPAVTDPGFADRAAANQSAADHSRTEGVGPGLLFDDLPTLGERARRFGELAFASVQEYARALKMAPSNLQKYLSGDREPGPATLHRLYSLGCNLNGLVGGKGEVFADNHAGRELRWRHLEVLEDPLAEERR